MPGLALALGVLAFWLGRRTRVPPPAPLSAADRDRLEELLK
jgi:hypothetical protein